MAGNSPLKTVEAGHSRRRQHRPVDRLLACEDQGCAAKSAISTITSSTSCPTLLEAARLPAPKSVNGVTQMPLHGVSMAYTFTDGTAKTRKKVAVLRNARQPGNLGRWLDGGDLAQEGHALGARTSGNSTTRTRTSPKRRTWPRNTRKSSRNYRRCGRRRRRSTTCLPLDDRRYERTADPTRPVAASREKAIHVLPGTSILHPLAAPQLLGKEHAITAYVDESRKDGAKASWRAAAASSAAGRCSSRRQAPLRP